MFNTLFTWLTQSYFGFVDLYMYFSTRTIAYRYCLLTLYYAEILPFYFISFIMEVIGFWFHTFIPVNDFTRMLCPVVGGPKWSILFYSTLGRKVMWFGLFAYLYVWFLGVVTYVQNTGVLSEGLHSIKKDRKKKKNLKSIGLY